MRLGRLRDLAVMGVHFGPQLRPEPADRRLRHALNLAEANRLGEAPADVRRGIRQDHHPRPFPARRDRRRDARRSRAENDHLGHEGDGFLFFLRYGTGRGETGRAQEKGGDESGNGFHGLGKAISRTGSDRFGAG